MKSPKCRRLARAWNHRFDHDLLSPRFLRRHRHLLSAAALFYGGVCAPRADRGGKTFLFPAIFVSFALFLTGVPVCYFWLLPKTILFFFHDTQSLGWAPELDGAAILFFRYSLHSRLRTGFRIARGRARSRAFRLGHLRIHGPHPALRHRAHFRSRHHHHADARCSHADRDEPADASALRELHLDRVVHATPAKPRAEARSKWSNEISVGFHVLLHLLHRMIAAEMNYDFLFKSSLSFLAPSSALFSMSASIDCP